MIVKEDQAFANLILRLVTTMSNCQLVDGNFQTESSKTNLKKLLGVLWDLVTWI